MMDGDSEDGCVVDRVGPIYIPGEWMGALANRYARMCETYPRLVIMRLERECFMLLWVLKNVTPELPKELKVLLVEKHMQRALFRCDVCFSVVDPNDCYKTRGFIVFCSQTCEETWDRPRFVEDIPPPIEEEFSRMDEVD